MNDISVRALAPGDIREISRLHETRDDLDTQGALRRTELLEWLAFHNPFARSGETTYYVASYAGRIVAYHGRMPVQFIIGGSVENGFFVHDLYVDPELREKGLGLALTYAIAHTIEEESPSFFCLYGMTPTNLMMQRRRGYSELVADSYLKRISFLEEAERALRFRFLARIADGCARTAMAAVDALASVMAPSPGVKISVLPRFGPELDALNERILGKIGICTLRTSAHLNWKYVDRPYPREILLGAHRNGTMSGYAVIGFSPYKKNHPIGMILDLTTDPDDTASIIALVRASVDYLRKQNARAIRCIMTDKRFAAVLKRLLFSREVVGQTMMLGNLHKTQLNSQITDLNSWHMTRGESDCFMLSP